MTGSRRVQRAAGPPAQRPVPTPPKLRPVTGVLRTVNNADDTAPRRAPRRGARRRRSPGPLPQRAIVLVGPMAAGKTSLGKRLARELGIPFSDSDALFVRAHGPITNFFADHGEAEFRRIEADLIAEQLQHTGPQILALGGGAVLTESTRERLQQHPVILLMTTQHAVLRTANLDKRPLLRDDPHAWGRILKERRPLYDEVADVTFRTDRATKDQLTERAAQWIRARGRAERRAGAARGTDEPKEQTAP